MFILQWLVFVKQEREQNIMKLQGALFHIHFLVNFCILQSLLLKGSPREEQNIRSNSEAFAAIFVVDWNVLGDNWQSAHWRGKIAQTSAKLQ